MTTASIDVRVTTPHKQGGFSPEKKRDYLRDMFVLTANIVKALDEDAADEATDLQLLQETSEDLSRQLWEEKRKNSPRLPPLAGVQDEATPDL